MKRALAGPLLVAALFAACGDDDDGDATTSTTADTSTTTEEPSTTSTTGTAAVEMDGADAVVRDWITAVAAGDDDTAISLTAPRSMEAIGGPEGFVDSEIALAEGWGSWDAAEDLELTVVELDGLSAAAIVVLHGEVALEAPPEERWTAVPVVATEDGPRVEPFLDLGHVEADPEGDTVIEPSPTFTAFVLGNRDVSFVVDDGDPVTPEVEGFDGDQQRASHDWTGELDPGVHGFTVVVTNDDGIMARTFTYRVE
jgi:hypothetical protein